MESNCKGQEDQPVKYYGLNNVDFKIIPQHLPCSKAVL